VVGAAVVSAGVGVTGSGAVAVVVDGADSASPSGTISRPARSSPPPPSAVRTRSVRGPPVSPVTSSMTIGARQAPRKTRSTASGDGRPIGTPRDISHTPRSAGRASSWNCRGPDAHSAARPGNHPPHAAPASPDEQRGPAAAGSEIRPLAGQEQGAEPMSDILWYGLAAIALVIVMAGVLGRLVDRDD